MQRGSMTLEGFRGQNTIGSDRSHSRQRDDREERTVGHDDQSKGDHWPPRRGSHGRGDMLSPARPSSRGRAPLPLERSQLRTRGPNTIQEGSRGPRAHRGRSRGHERKLSPARPSSPGRAPLQHDRAHAHSAELGRSPPPFEGTSLNYDKRRRRDTGPKSRPSRERGSGGNPVEVPTPDHSQQALRRASGRDTTPSPTRGIPRGSRSSATGTGATKISAPSGRGGRLGKGKGNGEKEAFEVRPSVLLVSPSLTLPHRGQAGTRGVTPSSGRSTFSTLLVRLQISVPIVMIVNHGPPTPT